MNSAKTDAELAAIDASATLEWPLGELDADTSTELAALEHKLRTARPTNLGFPGSVDFDYSALTVFFGHLLNNVGDPAVDGAGHNHTKHLEREIVRTLGALLRAPADDLWGYVSSGGSENNLYALYLARTLHPSGIVYHSDAAHYSVDKAAHLLNLPAQRVRTDDRGTMDYDHLTALVKQHADRPAIVVATVGTTMTEAVDDVRQIRSRLEELKVADRFIHADAALAGLPLALLDPDQRPGIDFADGADSVAISGHKFIGSPFPSGIVLVRASHRDQVAKDVDYISSPDSTITGSRSGHAPLLLWYAIRTLGLDGLRRRAEESRRLAAYTLRRLAEIGWEAFRHDHAFTVVLRTPPEQITKKWVLATSDGWSHLVCMPGVTYSQIDGFMKDLEVAAIPMEAARPVPVPRPRTAAEAADAMRGCF